MEVTFGWGDPGAIICLLAPVVAACWVLAGAILWGLRILKTDRAPGAGREC